MTARVLVLLLALAARAAAAGPADLAPLARPSADPAWRDLLAELGRPTNRVSEFLEQRFFPFRRTPVELPGTLRLSPRHGLSLHYEGAAAQTVIFDAQGVLVRNAAGQDRPAPDDPRARAFTEALGHVLHFDLPELEKNFAVSGRMAADGWRLRFAPRSAALEKFFSALEVSGQGRDLRQIEISSGGHPRVTIVIRSRRDDVTFSPDEVRTYFR